MQMTVHMTPRELLRWADEERRIADAIADAVAHLEPEQRKHPDMSAAFHRRRADWLDGVALMHIEVLEEDDDEPS